MTRDHTATVFDGVEYAPGRQFVVQVGGARLSGWVPEMGGARGWSQQLEPGDVLTCTGFGPGWGSDPGYGVHWTSEQSRAARAGRCDLSPFHGGIWAYRPLPGLLAPAEEVPS